MNTHYLSIFIVSGSPVLGQWVRTHADLVLTVIVIVWLLLTKAAAITTEDLEKALGEAVGEALTLAKITVKEAAAICRWDDSDLRKAIRGERHLDLTRLARLPFRFWLYFSPTLTYLVARKNVRDIAEDVGLVRRSA